MQTVKIPSAFSELINPNWRSLLYHGGRGGGKSWAVAITLLLQAREAALRIACLREIQNSIKDSVHKLLSDLIRAYEWDDYTITDHAIRNRVTGSEFIFKGLAHNIDSLKSLEGADIAWVEEGQSVSKDSLDWLTPTIRKPRSRIIVTMNRFSEYDPAWDRFGDTRRPGAYVRKVNYPDNPYFPDTLRQEMEFDRENNYDLYLHIWEGEPYGQTSDAVLPRTMVKAAMERPATDVAAGPIEWGLDVARMGDDLTVLVKRVGPKADVVAKWHKQSIDQTVDKVTLYAKPGELIKVDDTGLGGGVTDYLKRQRYNVAPVNFGGKPKNDTKYDSVASEMWFEFGEQLPEVCIPQDNDLFQELTHRQWAMDKRQRRCIQSKSEFKKDIHRSPDTADAMLLAFYQPKTARITARNLGVRY